MPLLPLCFFRAPELLRGDAGPSPASDVYSFGILLGECWSRREPYAGEDQLEVLAAVADSKRWPPHRPYLPPSVPDPWADLIRQVGLYAAQSFLRLPLPVDTLGRPR